MTHVDRCIEQVRTSHYLDLSHDLEIDKAIMYLKEKDFGKAAESLKSFEKKDNTKVASTAATNLAFLYYLVSVLYVHHPLNILLACTLCDYTVTVLFLFSLHLSPPNIFFCIAILCARKKLLWKASSRNIIIQCVSGTQSNYI